MAPGLYLDTSFFGVSSGRDCRVLLERLGVHSRQIRLVQPAAFQAWAEKIHYAALRGKDWLLFGMMRRNPRANKPSTERRRLLSDVPNFGFPSLSGIIFGQRVRWKLGLLMMWVRLKR